jgi:hypothetical protein
MEEFEHAQPDLFLLFCSPRDTEDLEMGDCINFGQDLNKDNYSYHFRLKKERILQNTTFNEFLLMMRTKIFAIQAIISAVVMIISLIIIPKALTTTTNRRRRKNCCMKDILVL